MRSVLVGTLLVFVAAGVAHADNKEVAKQAFVEGSRQYELGDFKAALEAFKRAYLNYEEPAFLFNIAQCQRQLGDKAEAMRTYKVFLHKVPDSPQRAEVERIVGDLQAALDQEKAARARPPTDTMQPSPSSELPPTTTTAPPGTTAPATANVPPAATSSAPAVPATPASESERRPFYKKWWLWTVVGGVVVVGVGLGVGLAVGLSHGNNT
ncbi:MAG TPA: tetratricopeptide repeat protein, partial [Polyangia bacterium]